MSLTKNYLFSQPEYQPIETNLEDAQSNVQSSIRQLESIENLDQLDFETLINIAHRLKQADAKIQAAINQGGVH